MIIKERRLVDSRRDIGTGREDEGELILQRNSRFVNSGIALAPAPGGPDEKRGGGDQIPRPPRRPLRLPRQRPSTVRTAN